MALVAGACGDDSPGDADAAGADARAAYDAAPAPDADPLTTIEPGQPFVVSDLGQNEDPAVLVTGGGQLYAAWYSNRNGLQPDGREDKEIFLTRSLDGRLWTQAVQVSQSDELAFYPALAEGGTGEIHAVWWQVRLIPEGCTPEVDCTGTDNRIRYASSDDGFIWELGADTEIAGGPGDWLPSIVYDVVSGRLLVYFAAVVRDADGNTDFGETTTRIYVVVHDGNSWSAPARLPDVINPDTSHNTYPHVIQDDNADFAMTWTRYDAAASSDVLAVLSEPSTETMYATSSDGLSWSTPVELSGGASEGAIDVFPYLHVEHSGEKHVTWLSATQALSRTWDMPVNGTYPDDRVPLTNVAGYTARIAATRTPGVYFGAWVEGDNPDQFVVGQLFSK